MKTSTEHSSQSRRDEGLKLCPFCGSKGHLVYSSDREIVNVRCTQWGPGKCLGAGPNCYDENEAIAGWNRRIETSSETRDWQPIESAPKGRKVIAGYKNALGNWRSVMARYYTPYTLEDDEQESGYAPEGWYEEVENTETIHLTDFEPTHWQPLPESPNV